jgi:eukaryotic translation initiation factor 2C
VPFSQLTGDQAADMIKHAAQKPMDRSQSIKQWFAKLNYAAQPKLQSWGLEVRPQMMEVDARVLPTPKVTYKGNKTLNCQFGGWNLKGVSFTRPGRPLQSWSVLSLDRYFGEGDMQNFIGFFTRQMTMYGINVVNERPALVEGDNRKSLKDNVSEAARQAYVQSKTNPQIILVLLPVSFPRFVDIRTDPSISAATLRCTRRSRTSRPCSSRSLFPPSVSSCRSSGTTVAWTNTVVTVSYSRVILSNEHVELTWLVSMKMQAKLGGVTHEVPVPVVSLEKKMLY